ncbi:MAG: FAD-dependent monooxygenase [Actinobacteria bacterium]|nr:FAD-dependent monooxygenase [Actinomycetota bacterium]
MNERTAEIAGGGLAGLTAAALLARRGWNVTVHERGEELREIGAGIFMWENGLRVLESLGIFEEAVGRGERIEAWQLFDERRRRIQGEWLNPDGVRLITVLRTDLHRALAGAAASAGVEIRTGSRVLGAREDGTLVLEDGSTRAADLLIGADGVGSAVRDSLGLTRSVRNLHDGCGRHLIPRASSDPIDKTLEYWKGARRVGVVPCSPDEVYVYLCCPESDLVGRAKPLDRASWTASFPHLEGVIARIPETGRWAAFSDSVCHSWQRGKAAVIGDAAHAMSPNLGQGACVAMANAAALAAALDRGPDTATALAEWERTERPITDATQRYSRVYGLVGTAWPARLLDLRSALVWAGGRSKRVQQRVNVAAAHVPPPEPASIGRAG